DAISAPVRRRGRHHRPAAARVVASVNDPPHAVAIEAASDEHVAAPCEFDGAIRVAARDVSRGRRRRGGSQYGEGEQEPGGGAQTDAEPPKPVPLVATTVPDGGARHLL